LAGELLFEGDIKAYFDNFKRQTAAKRLSIRTNDIDMKSVAKPPMVKFAAKLLSVPIVPVPELLKFPNRKFADDALRIEKFKEKAFFLGHSRVCQMCWASWISRDDYLCNFCKATNGDIHNRYLGWLMTANTFNINFGEVSIKNATLFKHYVRACQHGKCQTLEGKSIKRGSTEEFLIIFFSNVNNSRFRR
jgi:hypothetical protein